MSIRKVKMATAILIVFNMPERGHSKGVFKKQQFLHSQKLRTVVGQKYHPEWYFLTHPARMITKSTCIVTSNVDRAIINAEAAKEFGKRNNVPILRWKWKSSLDFPLSVEAILYDKDERPELFAYFVRGGCGQVLDNAHGNVYFGVANGTACTMHSLAWGTIQETKKMLTMQ
jgi:hypothetical protein